MRAAIATIGDQLVHRDDTTAGFGDERHDVRSEKVVEGHIARRVRGKHVRVSRDDYRMEDPPDAVAVSGRCRPDDEVARERPSR